MNDRSSPRPSPVIIGKSTPHPTPAQSSSQFMPGIAYTSVIIDARGLPFTASMSPSILADAQEIFPLPGRIDTDFVVNVGLAAYVYGSLDDARRSRRAGKHPLCLKALSARNRSTVVLSSQAGKDLQTANRNSGILKNFKVVFLLDK